MAVVPTLSTAVSLDDVETAAAFGFYVEHPDGWDAPPARAADTVKLPGRAGARRIGAGGAGADGARTLTLRGAILAGDAETMRTRRDALLAAIAPAVVRVRCAEPLAAGLPGRELFAEVESVTFPAPPNAGHLVAAHALGVEIVFTCPDPYKYDVEDTEVTLSTGGTALPLGTAPVRPVVTMTGGGTLALKHGVTGATVATLAVTGGGTIVVDFDALTVTSGGVSIIDTALADAAQFFAIDPAACANYALAQWPLLACTVSATAVYRRAWR